MSYSSIEDLSDQERKLQERSTELKKDPITNPQQQPKVELTPGRKNLKSWLGRSFRIEMTDGRILIGIFLCTDADANVILEMCSESTKKDTSQRYLGLVMVPGRHIVTMEVDMSGNAG